MYRSMESVRGGREEEVMRPPAWSSSYAWARSSSSYRCGYCKREFRSAQALGGHMNVHRRERARLRHHYYHYCTTTTAVPNLSPPATSTPVIYSFFSTAATTETPTFDLEVNLELGVGGRFSTNSSSDGQLDLELRLGC